MATYKFQSPAEQEKLGIYGGAGKNGTASGGTASDSAARSGYGRTASDSAGRSVYGSTTRMGAEQQGRMQRDIKRVQKSAKKAKNKKRSIKIYLARRLVKKLKDKQQQAMQTGQGAQRADAEAVNQAVDRMTSSASQSAMLTAHAVRKYSGKAARAVYGAAKERVENHAIAKSVRRVVRKQRRPDGTVRKSFRYEAMSARDIRRAKLKKRQRYEMKRRTQSGRMRQAAKRQANAGKAAASEIYGVGRKKTALIYKPNVQPGAAARVPLRGQGAAQRMIAAPRNGAGAASYKRRAKAGAVRRLRNKMLQRSGGQAVGGAAQAAAGTAGHGVVHAARSALGKLAAVSKGKLLAAAVVALLFVCMITAPVSVIASALGILFADENTASSAGRGLVTVKTAYLNAQFDWSERALSGVRYDRVVYEGSYAQDVDVLAVFAVKTTELDGMDVIEMDRDKQDALKKVYREMNPYNRWIEVVDKVRILHIEVNGMTAEEAARSYHFNRSQMNMLRELLDEYRGDLRKLLEDIFGAPAVNLDPAVLALQALVEKYAKKYGISDYVGTLLAIIQVESGGRLEDVMQSSESMGLPPNSLGKEESVNQGCKYFSELVAKAKRLGCDGDAVIQAYNYGSGFLDYVARNGKKYSFELAEAFAKDKSGGVRVTYKNPISIPKNGGWRYNYGNMFYVLLVQQYTGGAAYGSETYQALMKEAEKYIGMPYVFGGSTPQTSFDCSGYICWVYTHSGVYNLPRTTAYGIYRQCTPVSAAQAQPGDLVFFEKTYNCPEPVSHIGIYVGNGKMLHCGDVRPDRTEVEVDERRAA